MTIPNPHILLEQLSLDTSTIQHIDLLSERHGHAVWRIATPERSYVLKWLPDEAARIEVRAYALLHDLGVPTLPLYGSTAQALLLEDLAHSNHWRLATEADITQAEVGQAVARWYRVFHSAGEALLTHPGRPNYLRRETDTLTSASLLAAGRILDLAESPPWTLAIEQIDLLKVALEKLSLTLNYNDFHWTNLALSRNDRAPQEAIIFDYHLLGMGMRTSDCRNVAGSLCGAAVETFWETYGEVDPREATLDCPLADLHGLQSAAHMQQFPRWAEACRERALNGNLEQDLLAAIDLASSLCAMED